MRCFVEVNHSPFSRILCRCTSCRDDVVTMAAKPRRRRREERDGERKSRRKQIQNQIQRRRKKEEREGKKREGRGRRREAQKKCWCVFPCEARRSDLLSSLSTRLLISLSLNLYNAGAPDAPHQSHSSSVWFANSNGDYDLWWRYEDLTARWKCRWHLLNHLIPIISCTKIQTFLSIPQMSQTRRSRISFLWLDCLLALYSMWTLPRVYVCQWF